MGEQESIIRFPVLGLLHVCDDVEAIEQLVREIDLKDVHEADVLRAAFRQMRCGGVLPVVTWTVYDELFCFVSREANRFDRSWSPRKFAVGALGALVYLNLAPAHDEGFEYFHFAIILVFLYALQDQSTEKLQDLVSLVKCIEPYTQADRSSISSVDVCFVMDVIKYTICRKNLVLRWGWRGKEHEDGIVFPTSTFDRLNLGDLAAAWRNACTFPSTWWPSRPNG